MKPAMKAVVYGLVVVVFGAAVAIYKYMENRKASVRESEKEFEQLIGKRPHLVDPFNNAIMAEPTVQRFVLVQRRGLDASLAMDTQTGRVCRTWDWSLKEDSEQNGIDEIPTCRAMLISDGE